MHFPDTFCVTRDQALSPESVILEATDEGIFLVSSVGRQPVKRRAIEALIEMSIALLDKLDPDPDLEPDAYLEKDGCQLALVGFAMSPRVLLTGSEAAFFVAIRPCPDDMPSLQQFACYEAASAEARRLIRGNSEWVLVDEAAQSQRARRKILTPRYDSAHEKSQ